VPQGVLDGSELAVQPSGQLAQGRPGRLGATGADEVGHGLGLVQAEPAVEECPAGEFARRRRPRTGLPAGPQRFAGHRPAAVAVDLHRVLTCVRTASEQGQKEAAIDLTNVF